MKVGDLVRPISLKPFDMDGRRLQTALWKGIIVDWEGTEPIVFWNERFPAEIEYKEQLEVISEGR